MTTCNRIVLGASDPEMTAIAAIGGKCGVPVVQAIGVDGRLVHPGNAYQAHEPRPLPGDLWVEARPAAGSLEGIARVDHHFPGDPGYGLPPREFLRASSLGQVISCLAQGGGIHHWEEHPGLCGGAPGSFLMWGCDHYVADATPGATLYRQVPQELVLTAAADHCLSAAYAGQCPGVGPDTLIRWRAKERAAFQGRSVEAVLADVEAARRAIRAAPNIFLRGIAGRDMRALPVPELPDAAARDGQNVLTRGLSRRGEPEKMNAMGGQDWCEAFLAAVRAGDVDGTSVVPSSGYGDPARGIVGAHPVPA